MRILFFSYGCTETQVAGSILAGCFVSYLDEYPYAGNVRFSCFFKWMQRGPSHRFDYCQVYFSSLNPSLLNCGDLIFLLQMQRNQVAGSITAGCTFYSRGDFVRFNRIPSVVRPTSVTISLFTGRHRGLPLRKT